MWTLLLIVALLLVLTIGYVGVLFTYFLAIANWNYAIIEKYHKSLAISLDQLGNVMVSPLFNRILIKPGSSDQFGNPDETISSVLGKNKRSKTLRYLGKRLDAWLNGIDKNHSIKAIEEDEG